MNNFIIAGWCNGSTGVSEALSIRSNRVPTTKFKLSCNRVVEGSGLQNHCGEIPVAGSNPADSSKSGVVHEWLMWAPC